MFRNHKRSRAAAISLSLSLLIFVAGQENANGTGVGQKAHSDTVSEIMWSGDTLMLIHGEIQAYNTYVNNGNSKIAAEAKQRLTSAKVAYATGLTRFSTAVSAAFKASPISLELLKRVEASDQAIKDNQSKVAIAKTKLAESNSSLSQAIKEFDDAKAAADQSGAGRDASGGQIPSAPQGNPVLEAAQKKVIESETAQMSSQKTYDAAVSKLKTAQADLEVKVSALKKDPVLKALSKFNVLLGEITKKVKLDQLTKTSIEKFRNNFQFGRL